MPEPGYEGHFYLLVVPKAFADEASGLYTRIQKEGGTDAQPAEFLTATTYSYRPGNPTPVKDD
jgi:hypothetical protein